MLFKCSSGAWIYWVSILERKSKWMPCYSGCSFVVGKEGADGHAPSQPSLSSLSFLFLSSFLFSLSSPSSSHLHRRPNNNTIHPRRPHSQTFQACLLRFLRWALASRVVVRPQLLLALALDVRTIRGMAASPLERTLGVSERYASWYFLMHQTDHSTDKFRPRSTVIFVESQDICRRTART